MRLGNGCTMLTLVLISLLASSVSSRTSLGKNIDRITAWTRQLSVEVHRAFEKSFGLSRFQSLIDKASYGSVATEGNGFLHNISIAIDEKLLAAIRTVIVNKELIEAEYLVTQQTVATNCCDSAYEEQHYARFKNKVNKNLTCVILPSAQDKPKITSSLEMVYKSNLIKSEAIKWQYFGSTSGSYHQYPANERVCSKTETFDPRLRSWYVGAVMSTRKNLVIIIDKSTSMIYNDRMSLVKAAALTVLDTLRPEDYVTAIAFSSKVFFPPGCFGKTLAKATPSNLKVLKNWITNLLPRGGTIYSLAFQEAFKCFKSSGSADSGQNIILFLTDGEPYDDPAQKIYPSTQKGQQQMTNAVTILTYGLGRGIKQSAKDVLKKIASINGGEFLHIEDGSPKKLRSAFGSYYNYFQTLSGNLALGKPTLQSSTESTYAASHAVDGRQLNAKCSKTAQENNPWWRVDLDKETYIMAVTVVNCCGAGSLKNVEVVVVRNGKNGKNASKVCGVISELADKQSVTTMCPDHTAGRHVVIRIPGRNRRLALCEVKIYNTFAPSSTLSMPCINDNGVLFGVAAVDLSLSEVFSNLLSFSYGQYSYGAVIDVKGRVWIHPRAPYPEQSKFGPSLLPLKVYESWASQSIMQKIMSVPHGDMQVDKVLLQFPRGYSSTDGISAKEVNATIHWKRIRNMFILILVTMRNDTNMWLVSGKVAKESFQPSDENLGVCQLNGTEYFPRASAVKLPPRLKIGTANLQMKSNVSSVPEMTNETKKDIQDQFHPGVEADVAITKNLEREWKKSRKKENNIVIWRYVGTQSGVYRRYPGVTMTASFNHKHTPWFRRAVIAPKQLALSHPFSDPYGLGSVISISKAILKESNNSHDLAKQKTRIMAIAGIDVALNPFRRMVLNQMPGCVDKYDCYFMDQSGNLFLKLNEEEKIIHVTEKFSWLGKQFVEILKILQPSWCNNYQDLKIHMNYKSVLPKKLISKSTDVCRQYVVLPLQDISASVLLVPSRRIHKSCQDQLPGDHAEGCYSAKTCHTCSLPFSDCQSPCTCPMSFDRCSNSIISTFTRITCPVSGTPLASRESSTKAPDCEKICNMASSKQECLQIQNCTWCENNIIDSCESFCPFNRSQKIGLQFRADLKLLLPGLNAELKAKVEAVLQEALFNILGEKLENNIHPITFKQRSISLTIQGSSVEEIFKKIHQIKESVESRSFCITITHKSRTQQVCPERLYVLGINECASEVDNCNVHAYCNDTEEFYDCVCKTGFQGDGTNCTDVNECSYFPCHSNATCSNYVGSFDCMCLEGFSGNGFNCSDVNECNDSPCHSNALCNNHIGSFECMCLEGFSGNGFNCSDVNECNDSPCHSNALCNNRIGSFECTCLEGFSGNGFNCSDVNECLNSPCHSNATCTNQIGSFRCICLEGFSGNGFNCSDIDECKVEPCHPNSTCINVPGSYECSCITGFSGNGSVCLDINECDYSPCHLNASCTNIIGSFVCDCVEGFFGDGIYCSDYDECEEKDVCHQNASCTNTQGTYSCVCLPGFSGDGRDCREPLSGEPTQKLTAATVGHSLKKNDNYPDIPVLVLITASFGVGTSFGLCCFIVIILRRKRSTNKIVPKHHNHKQIHVVGVHDRVQPKMMNEENVYGRKLQSLQTTHTSTNLPGSFKIVSQMSLEWDEVEV